MFHRSASRSRRRLARVWILRSTTWSRNSVSAASCRRRVVSTAHGREARFSFVVASDPLCFAAQGKTLKSYEPRCSDTTKNLFCNEETKSVPTRRPFRAQASFSLSPSTAAHLLFVVTGHCTACRDPSCNPVIPFCGRKGKALWFLITNRCQAYCLN